LLNQELTLKEGKSKYEELEDIYKQIGLKGLGSPGFYLNFPPSRRQKRHV
jgi:hypothetical protein